MLFVIAEKLGRTVAELGRSLSKREFDEWRIFYKVRAEQEEAARKAATNEAQRGGRRGRR